MNKPKPTYFGLRIDAAEFELWKSRARAEHRSIAMLVRLAMADRLKQAFSNVENGEPAPVGEEL